MTIEEDWERVSRVWNKVRQSHWNPQLAVFLSIYNLRKIDRGIDYPLRRLLRSEKYRHRIRLYGGPTGSFGRYPFRDGEGRVWSLIKLKEEE